MIFVSVDVNIFFFSNFLTCACVDWIHFASFERLKTILICAASSSNTYTKTFGGIDGAGKRLADEVSLGIFVCVKTSDLHLV